MAFSLSTAKSTMDPNDLVTRAIRARRQFKAVVRRVIQNVSWLGDVEDEQISSNVKKNVQLLKQKKGKKSLLTLHQKSILCKPAEERSEQEKLLLYRIIGGLKCFRKYPENVKLQLAGVTYFVFYGPGRTIVRQNHEAHALYFIVSGEVAVSISAIDPVLKETITVNVGTMLPGSMFGEVSLLHDIPRTATITTITQCELLCLKKADFDVVLKASVTKQWVEIQAAMKRFTYFRDWDEVAIRECCIYSKIKSYEREQTILGDDAGISSSTYFILKGKCRIIEHLLVEAHFDAGGRKLFKLYQPKTIKEGEKSVDHHGAAVLDEKKESALSLIREHNLSFPMTRPSWFKSRRSSGAPRSSVSASFRSDSERKSALSEDHVRRKSVIRSSLFKSGRISGGPKASISSSAKLSSEKKSSVLSDGHFRRKSIRSYSETNLKPIDMEEIKVPFSDEAVVDLPPGVETHFMQVCILSETACFGIGENLRSRRVVAMSDHVECLLIPRYWLIQKNKGNLWTRIQQYLDTQIPNTQQIFHEFIHQRKWISHRRMIAEDCCGKTPVNTYHNVPYSIRIKEGLEFH